MTNVHSMESLRPKDNGQTTKDKDRSIKKNVSDIENDEGNNNKMSNDWIKKWVKDKNRKHMSQFYGDKLATSEYRVECR